MRTRLLILAFALCAASVSAQTWTPTISISPATATVAADKTRTFSAKRTNTTQAVRWTSPGGTMTETGVFTAGKVAGKFPVIATLADGSASTMATVTVTVPARTLAVSDIGFAAAVNGWGPVERDRSNGEQLAKDGVGLAIAGRTFAKGLGVHATSRIEIALNGCNRFTSYVGVDEEVGDLGSVIFQVLVDGVSVYNSDLMTGAMVAKYASVTIPATAKLLALQVGPSPDGSIVSDHADWGDPKLVCTGPMAPLSSTDDIPPPPVGAVILEPGSRIQSAVDNAPGATTFILKAGVHRLQEIRPKEGNVFRGEPGAILTGARVLTPTRVGSYFVVTGQTQEGQPNGDCLPAFPRCSRPEELFLDGKPLVHVEALSKVVPGAWFFDYGADTIYMADDPAGKLVETSVIRHAFLPTANTVTIEGITIEKYASPMQHGAVQAENTTGWIVRKNVIQWNHGGAFRIGHKTQAIENKVLDNGQIGIVGVGDDVLIEGNEIARNGGRGVDVGWEGGGTKFVKTNRLVVRGNFVHHNYGPGLWGDIDNRDGLIENNRSEDNDRIGIFWEISYKATIRQNAVRRNGFGFSAWGWGGGIIVAASTDVEVGPGNIVEDNADGIVAILQSRAKDGGGVYDMTNLHVHDNTIRMAAGWSGVLTDTGDLAVYTGKNNRFAANRYTLVGTGNRFTWMNQGDVTPERWRGFGQDTAGAFVIQP